MNESLRHQIREARKTITERLIRDLCPQGHWIGELSSSALATATATIALVTVDPRANGDLVDRGLDWLARNANPDGGWGDTLRSRSNLSTTALVWAAFGVAHADGQYAATVSAAVDWLTRTAGSMDLLVSTIEGRYGKDRTFSVPIVMTLALSGRLGPQGWQRVRPLPFELAALPRAVFGALQLPVVSYALPALIAIGQAIYHHAPRFNPLRRLTRQRTLNLLTTLQPGNGGFLEATPLTSFVTMSLASMGEAQHPVAQRGVGFLRASVRPDGSWPIDTNLSTWVTTLSVKALHHSPNCLDPTQHSNLKHWLLAQQYRVEHPYTGAAPGGWAWTDLPGGVPDADDTAGALLALHYLGRPQEEPEADLREAARLGIHWLLDLQNRDGGIPTFCRGWGTLPFDRSAPELTAHALRAWCAWLPHLPPKSCQRIQRGTDRAIRFLEKSQRKDGSWIPLWFGNEHTEGEANPVYGTAQVLLGLQSIRGNPAAATLHHQGSQFLAAQQNPDGGWGGTHGAVSTIEETSLALDALADETALEQTLEQGAQWLIQAVNSPTALVPSPIGLYFARLWYFERLYPLIFACGALGRLDSKSA